MATLNTREDLGPGFISGTTRNILGHETTVLDENGEPVDFSPNRNGKDSDNLYAILAKLEKLEKF